MTFELTPVEAQRVDDLVAAFAFTRSEAHREVMYAAGYPIVCDLIPVNAACNVCGKTGRRPYVFWQDGRRVPYCRQHADAEVRRLTGGRGL